LLVVVVVLLYLVEVVLVDTEKEVCQFPVHHLLQFKLELVQQEFLTLPVVHYLVHKELHLILEHQ
jgi:hypothetical protein